MAMMDESQRLISYIRNSFVTSDDTGMCELIIDLDDNNEKHNPLARPPSWFGSQDEEDMTDSDWESDGELAHSMDIAADMDLSGHRPRSNTTQRLDKIRWEKHKTSKIKNIPWREMSTGIGDTSDEDETDPFEKKDLRNSTASDSKRRSALSLQLESITSCPNNPFSEYARFDGSSTPNVPTTKMDIYLTMAPEDERFFPMTIITLNTARVSDVIGLICWQYSAEQRQPPLREELEAFSLYQVEDDGEVDYDMPALDNKKPIYQFGFKSLAIVEKDIPKRSETVKINLPERGFSTFELESSSILLKEVLQKVLQKRKLGQDSRHRYRLECQNEPDVALDLDLPLSAFHTREFCLVRENSSRVPQDPKDPSTSSCPIFPGHTFYSYMVVMDPYRKLKTCEVQLGISSGKIEIDPAAKSIFPLKHKAYTYEMDHIEHCSIIETKSSGKAIFRLVYKSLSDNIRSHDFKSDINMAQEIVEKITHILRERVH